MVRSHTPAEDRERHRKEENSCGVIFSLFPGGVEFHEIYFDNANIEVKCCFYEQHFSLRYNVVLLF